MIQIDQQQYHLQTMDTSYVFCVTASGHLEHLYYGQRINLLGGSRALYEKHDLIAGNTLNYSKEYPNVALEDTCLEVSGIGKGDIREAFIEVILPDGTNTSDFVFESAAILPQQPTLVGLPSSYGADQTLEVVLKDQSGLVLTLTYCIYERANTITRSAKLTNGTDQPVQLARLMSAQLDLDTSDYTLTTFNGAWAREMGRNDKPLAQGTYITDSKAGNSSNRSNPFIMLAQHGATEDAGSCFGFNLVYSGNHYEAVEVSPYGKTRVLWGINPFSFRFTLEPGDTFQAPEAVLSFSHEGYNGLSHNLHRFVRAHIVRGPWQYKPRPVLVNNWEGTYFSFNEARIVKLAKAAKRVGAELFVLDDGWFGQRNDDTRSLGDWTVNRKKLAGGLDGLAKKINQLGMDFGIWVEPEMVNEDSDLYRAHPDWAVQIPGRKPTLGRNQMILDFTQAPVREYIIEKMVEVFGGANIAYVKWDMNRIFSDMHSPSLPPHRQQEFFHRYILGLYEILDTLTKRFPNILFESCSSGGNRFDLGMLCYMPQTWASDNTDAICRAEIQNSYSYGYPMCTVGAHVSAVPNHQTLRQTPLATRFEVASFGLLGYELDLSELPAQELSQIASQVAFYKKHRDLLQFGRFYRIASLDHGNTCQWMVVASDGSKAMALYLQRQAIPNQSYAKLTAKGLTPTTIYRVRNRPTTFSIKAFGDLINMISPIHIKKDSLAHNLIARFKKMHSEREDVTANGDLLCRAGMKLAQSFSGTGYNERIRFFPDYGSRLYLFEKQDAPVE